MFMGFVANLLGAGKAPARQEVAAPPTNVAGSRGAAAAGMLKKEKKRLGFASTRLAELAEAGYTGGKKLLGE
jgi:hypothetical protein